MSGRGKFKRLGHSRCEIVCCGWQVSLVNYLLKGSLARVPCGFFSNKGVCGVYISWTLGSSLSNAAPVQVNGGGSTKNLSLNRQPSGVKLRGIQGCWKKVSTWNRTGGSGNCALNTAKDGDPAANAVPLWKLNTEGITWHVPRVFEAVVECLPCLTVRASHHA